jgi:hypothetical protein
VLALTKYITDIIHQVGGAPGQGRPQVGLPPSQQAGGVLREAGHRAVPATPPQQAQARQHAASIGRRRRRTQRGRQMIVNFHGGIFTEMIVNFHGGG